MHRITRELDRIFQDFGLDQQTFSPYSTLGSGFTSGLNSSASTNDLWRTPAQAMQTTWSPRIDVVSRGKHLVVRADLPGLTKEDVSIEVGDGILTIHGERSDVAESADEGYYFTERNFGTFYRTLPIPEGIQAEQIQASFRNGILEITMPNPAASEQHRRKVTIQG